MWKQWVAILYSILIVVKFSFKAVILTHMGLGEYITEFILSGVTEGATACITLFVLCLIIYSVTLLVNVSIIVLSRSNPQLYTPMYLFLSHLPFVDIGCSCLVKHMFFGFLWMGTYIPVAGFVAQFWSVVTFEWNEFFLLAAMSYDCYVANAHLYSTPYRCPPQFVSS